MKLITMIIFDMMMAFLYILVFFFSIASNIFHLFLNRDSLFDTNRKTFRCFRVAFLGFFLETKHVKS